MFIRAYLRASTTEQDAKRAKQSLDDFIRPYGVQIACYYAENASGRVLDRPELNRLLMDSTQGDILLVESIDRLTRLKPQDWQTLKNRINEKSLKIICIDLPTSHKALSPQGYDELTDSMLIAVNTLMIEIMASFASKDYEQRRQRQSQGIAKAKALGKYKGRKTNLLKYQKIINLLKKDLSHRQICDLLKCSPSTIQSAIKWHGNVDKEQLSFTKILQKSK